MRRYFQSLALVFAIVQFSWFHDVTAATIGFENEDLLGAFDDIAAPETGKGDLNIFQDLNLDTYSDFLNDFRVPGRAVEQPLTKILEAYAAAPSKETLGALKNYLDANPDSYPGWLAYGLWAAEQQMLFEAQIAAREARRLGPADARTYTLDGVVLLVAGARSEAVAAFQKSLDRDPGNLLAQVQLARIFLESSLTSRAIVMFESILQTHGAKKETLPSMLDWAELLVAIRQFDQADTLLSSLEKQVSEMPALRERWTYLSALAAFENGDIARAGEMLSRQPDWPQLIDHAALLLARVNWTLRRETASMRQIEVYFDHPVLAAAARDSAAKFAYQDGRVLLAIEHLKQAATRSSGRLQLDFLSRTAALYDEIGLREEGAALLAENARNSVGSPDGYWIWADFLIERKDYGAALETIDEGLIQHPKFSPLSYLKGISLFSTGRLDDAKVAFRDAVNASPENTQAWVSLAKVAHEEGGHGGPGRHDEVIRIYREALTKIPDNPIILLELGKIALEEGRSDEAINFFEKTNRVTGGDPLAQSLLAMTLVEGEEQLDEAKRLAETALETLPGHVTTRFAMGRVLLSEGSDLLTAAKFFDEANASRPSHGHSLAFAAEAYDRAGKSDLAVDRASRALHLALRDDEVQMAHGVLIRHFGTNVVTASLRRIDENGAHEEVGSVSFQDTPNGMLASIKIRGLSMPHNGFHVHENPSCDPAFKDGKLVAGLAAGGHLGGGAHGDHAMHASHAVADEGTVTLASVDKGAAQGSGKQGHGGHAGALPIGDLPHIMSNGEPITEVQVTAPRLHTSLITNRSVMVHDGMVGARIACGVVR